MNPKPHPTRDKLRAIFEYRDGYLYWKTRPNNRVDINKPAGAVNDSQMCRFVTVDGIRYKHSRLTYIYHHGNIPAGLEICHMNHILDDDNISNLKAMTRSQIQANAPTRSHNKSGTTGVSWHPQAKAWRSNIIIGGKLHPLGYYKDIKYAVIARELANQFFKARIK